MHLSSTRHSNGNPPIVLNGGFLFYVLNLTLSENFETIYTSKVLQLPYMLADYRKPQSCYGSFNGECGLTVRLVLALKKSILCREERSGSAFWLRKGILLGKTLCANGMDTAEKIKICSMKLKGASIYEIAETVGVTPQNVYAYLRTFPHTKDNARRKPMDDSLMLKICTDYIMGDTMTVIGHKYEVTDSEVLSVFNYLVARKPIRIKSRFYPKIITWMFENSCTLADLARGCHTSISTLSNILSGHNGTKMSYEIANAISEFTGLTFTEIFEYQIENELNARRLHSVTQLPETPRTEEVKK